METHRNMNWILKIIKIKKEAYKKILHEINQQTIFANIENMINETEDNHKKKQIG